MTQTPSRDDVIEQDVADLHKLGYAQELFRSMGGFSNFAISFSIISILTGAVILYDYGLAWAGTAAVLIGWPFITLFVLCIAASMGEIASAYPTAGGLYYWASRMKSKNWGWWTAWLNLIGQFAIVAGINFAAALFINATIVTPLLSNVGIDYGNTTSPARHGRATDPRRLAADDGHPHARPARHQHRRHQSRRAPEPGQRVVAHRDRRGGRRARVPGRQARRVRPHPVRDPAAGHRRQLEQQPRLRQPPVRPRHQLPADPRLLLLAAPGQLDVHGYDASAHVAEETVGARKASAWGIFLSVAVSAVVGYIFLFTLSTHLPNLSTLFPNPLPDPLGLSSQYYFGDGAAVIDILIHNLGPTVGGVLSAGIAIAMWFCGLSAIASAGRMLFAFSRDDGVPGSGWLKKVSHRYRTPANSLIAIVVIAWLFSVAAFFVGRGVAVIIVTAISTIFLYAAYGVVIYLGATTQDWVQERVWSLGRWSKLIAWVAIAWILVLMVLFSFPTSGNISFPFMVAVVLFLLVYYFGWARSRFKGPRAMGDAAELTEIEREFERAAGEVQAPA